jgi:hypothetical protein
MSLLSETDRLRVINALEYYKENIVKYDAPEKLMEYNALINWIKLENYKNAN